MKRQMSIEQRLREYAQWLREPGLEVGMGDSVLARIRDEQHNAGAAEPLRSEIIDGVSCRPDGGLGRLAERMEYALRRDMRCRDIHDLALYLPPHHREVLAATYESGEPRSVREAAERLGISRGQYCERKAALLGWFEGAMFRGMAA
jgi:hypothetical protein